MEIGNERVVGERIMIGYADVCWDLGLLLGSV